MSEQSQSEDQPMSFDRRTEGESSAPTAKRPRFPLAVEVCVLEIEKRARTILQECGERGQPWGLLVDAEKVTEIMVSCAAEVFAVKAQYYESQPGFRLEFLDELAEDIVFDTLKLLPLNLLDSPRVLENRDGTVASLRKVLQEARKLRVRDSKQAAKSSEANLSQRQWDLLRNIVDKYQLKNSAEFFVTEDMNGCWLTYSPGPSTRVIRGDLDELRRQNLIHLERNQSAYRGWPTQLGITVAYSSVATPLEPRHSATPGDPDSWRSRREEFESLPPGDYSLSWSTRPPTTLTGTPLASHWNWRHYPDEGLKTRVNAIALKCARALGRDSEDGWFDELRKQDFAGFQLTGSGQQKQQDGSMVDFETGVLRDVVKHSITLCHVLEAEATPHRDESSQPARGDDHAEVSTITTPQPSPTAEESDSSNLVDMTAPPPPPTNMGVASTRHEIPQRPERRWDEIEIRFLSEERLQVITQDDKPTFNYAEFGFEDGRSKKPDMAWETLRSLAEARGTIVPAGSGPKRVALEKRIQKIRRRLRDHFGITDNPLPHTKGEGYRARFKVTCGPSYNS